MVPGASTSPHELPEDRLATTDERGRRVYLYPADARGIYRRRRDILSAILIAVFLALPWLKVGGHPAVLLDIPNRRFALFGLLFWAHEAPMLLFVMGGGIVLLAWVTAVWGRVWCGWACPQTVFVDSVFRRIERWIEGDALSRRRLDAAPWNADKALKKVLKWSAFVLASLILSHSFIAYFVGPEELGRMMRSSPAQSPGAFACMFGMFSLVLFDFGWFREQFCTLLCPYGRFQSVLMDDSSQLVAYQANRGEPRRGAVVQGQSTGDCVNCYRCVQVCPTGIDIRRGLQLECIACTACIDACDEVMTRIKKSKGLISYSRERASLRAKIYAGLLLALVAGFALTLWGRKAVKFELIRAAETPYQVLEGGRVVNHFKLNTQNQTFDDVTLQVTVDASETDAAAIRLVVSNHGALLPGGKSERADLFVDYPQAALVAGRGMLGISVSAKSADGARTIQTSTQEVPLVGPYR